MSRILKVQLPNAKIQNILKNQTNLFTFNQRDTNFSKITFLADIPQTIPQVYKTDNHD